MVDIASSRYELKVHDASNEVHKFEFTTARQTAADIQIDMHIRILLELEVPLLAAATLLGSMIVS